MAADNLQTVIVSKKTAKTRARAEDVARMYANRIYTSRETTTSWRFRQRPPEDFRKNSFRTKKLEGGVSLVYGTLKPSAKKRGNPGILQAGDIINGWTVVETKQFDTVEASRLDYVTGPLSNWDERYLVLRKKVGRGEKDADFRDYHTITLETRSKRSLRTIKKPPKHGISVILDDLLSTEVYFPMSNAALENEGEWRRAVDEIIERADGEISGKIISIKKERVRVGEPYIIDTRPMIPAPANTRPKKKNPDTIKEETRFMERMEPRIKGAEDGYDLAKLAREVQAMDLASETVRTSVLNALMARAIRMKLKPKGYEPRDSPNREWYFEMLLEHPTDPQGDLFGNPRRRRRKNLIDRPKVGDTYGKWTIEHFHRDRIQIIKKGVTDAKLVIDASRSSWQSTGKIDVLFVLSPEQVHTDSIHYGVESSTEEFSAGQWDQAIRGAIDWGEMQLAKRSKKNPEKNPGKPVRLRNPRTMPDPGAMSWLGTTLEWKWDGGQWENGKEDWLFLWSPKYKAVVAVKCPKKMDKQGKVSRSGGAAKMFERFMSRDPEATFEAEIPACKLVKLGKAVHIVYRSDKWKRKRKTEDYIHDFGKGVQLYCGPDKKNPEVFLCFGGKLTVTERGLVF